MNHIREEIDLVKESLKIESDKVMPNCHFLDKMFNFISAYYCIKILSILSTDFFSLNQHNIIKFSELYV